MKSKIVILFIGLWALGVIVGQEQWKHNKYRFDVGGYYLYLPAVFIYQDLAQFQFHKSLQTKLLPQDNDEVYLFPQKNTQKVVNQYTVGVAIWQLPFFLLAHGYTLATHGLADGYSTPYQGVLVWAALFWLIVGCMYLRKVLLLYFTDGVVAMVLGLLFAATNIYCYTVYEVGMSHVYELVGGIIAWYYWLRWLQQPKVGYMALAAFFAGLVVITRVVDVLLLLPIFFWGIASWEDMKQRGQNILQHKAVFLWGIVAFLGVLLLQLGYWKYASGHWIHFSYQRDRFDFAHAMIAKGLWSYRKGWLVYTPLVLACLAGIPLLPKYVKGAAIWLLLYLIIDVYVVFSWKNWWYGGGFGARAMMPAFLVLAVALGAFITYVLQLKSKWLQGVVGVFLLGCVALNVLQSYQYSQGIIHYDRMSKAYYWKIFGKTEVDKAALEQYLLDEREYWQECYQIAPQE